MSLPHAETLRIAVIDSHTGGEPTRVVLEGGIPLAGETMGDRRDDFARRFDHLRAGIVNEPRGNDVLVGAILTKPVNEGSTVGVVFFNNVGYLGMCGHGTIGVVETLRLQQRVQPGEVKIDTPVGTVSAELLENGEVSIRNVVSYRHLAGVRIDVPGLGSVVGDVGYGGNWFYIVHEPHFEIELDRSAELTDICWRIRRALEREGITGADGAEIDHIELFGEPTGANSDSRNFVLCPGGAYDRSPCGTGTSAKLACLYSAGKLKEGEWYSQESVTGSVFRGKVEAVEGGVIPTVVGRAFITAQTDLYFDNQDPLRWGMGV
ncbi:proline racemase family protein [Fimbriimonas ginsengisoli]|uniref:Putative proline racemase n=1 Tax=Fimbriimonas ginsengisoli Gsoil 348 TaxID=661478 RepID=A0A068NLB4_FIMGI|nr:proline racemase family protein [Fimbriimonas ginsengisoli]AIE84207.1 putative proline racemase [Fimbriimonas ginsengisoli Gsoil 348]